MISLEASDGEIKFLNLNPILLFLLDLNPFLSVLDWIPFLQDFERLERRLSKNGVVKNVSSTFLKEGQ